MIISVDDNLISMYEELREIGYNVYRFSEKKVSDVLIYSGNNSHISSLNISDVPSSSGGALLINGDIFSGEQIDNMILNKTYSSLF